MRVEVPFEDWVVSVFDPSVEDPWPPPAQGLDYLTRLFSDPLGGLDDPSLPTLYRSLFRPRCRERLGHLSELHLDHAACQESAIHGLGHRVTRHPDRAPAVLDRWLRTGNARDPRLRPYAESARSGCIQ